MFHFTKLTPGHRMPVNNLINISLVNVKYFMKHDMYTSSFNIMMKLKCTIRHSSYTVKQYNQAWIITFKTFAHSFFLSLLSDFFILNMKKPWKKWKKMHFSSHCITLYVYEYIFVFYDKLLWWWTFTILVGKNHHYNSYVSWRWFMYFFLADSI